MDSLRRYLESHLSRLDGIDAIVISDRDGVPIVSVAVPERQWTLDLLVKRGLAPSFCLAVEHAGRAGLGAANCCVCQFDQMTVIQLNCHPLIVTVTGQPGCNVGLATSLLTDKAFEEQVRRLQAIVPTDTGDNSLRV